MYSSNCGPDNFQTIRSIFITFCTYVIIHKLQNISSIFIYNLKLIFKVKMLGKVIKMDILLDNIKNFQLIFIEYGIKAYIDKLQPVLTFDDPDLIFWTTAIKKYTRTYTFQASVQFNFKSLHLFSSDLPCRCLLINSSTCKGFGALT